MPCDCDEEKNKLVKLRFVGGKHRPRAEQGPYHSFEPGKIYEVVSRCIDLPFWEAVEEQESTEVKIDFEYTDKEISTPVKSTGLTREFKGAPVSPADFFEAMDVEMLKHVIESNGGRVDGRWGRKRLIEEALKLQ